MIRSGALHGTALIIALVFLGCAPRSAVLVIQGDSRDQIWLSESSQVKVRAAQSRVVDSADRREILAAALVVLQDLGFQITVLDEVLGVVSGKKFVTRSREPLIFDPYYSLYDDESLIAFVKTYRSWGPFWHREDLIRLTVTVRDRNDEQVIVRASAQYLLRSAEQPEPYQSFFQVLESAMFRGRSSASNRPGQ